MTTTKTSPTTIQYPTRTLFLEGLQQSITLACYIAVFIAILVQTTNNSTPTYSF